MSLNIAIIGSGIAGLTAAQMLSEKHSVTVYEKKALLGLGSEGIELETDQGPTRIDVPPRVINQAHYPKLFQLLASNKIDTYPIYQQPCFCNTKNERVFSLWSGDIKLPLLSPIHLTLPHVNWTNIKWLAKHGRELLRWTRLLNSLEKEPLANPVSYSSALRPYLREKGFSNTFIEEYLYPIWALMCSATSSELNQYPAQPMLQLLKDFAGTSKTYRMKGGTKALEPQLIKNVKHIRLNAQVLSLKGHSDSITVVTSNSRQTYDHVIVATEPKIAQNFLSDEFETEKALLSKVPYRETQMVLHTDCSLMPNHQQHWSAVNLMLGKQNEPWASVWMNTIEQTQLPYNLFQTWDPQQPIQESKVIARRSFHRSLLTPESAQAMGQLRDLQAQSDNYRNLWFAGAYLTDQVPLLEEGVSSAILVAEKILQQPTTKKPLNTYSAA